MGVDRPTHGSEAEPIKGIQQAREQGMPINDDQIARAAIALLDQPIREPTQGGWFTYSSNPFDGRFLELDIVGCEDRGSAQLLVLRRSNAELHVLKPSRFGDMWLSVPDRTRGAAFAEQVALWLGSPLEDQPALVFDSAPLRVHAPKATLRSDRDSGGVSWVRHKLFLTAVDGRNTEMFLQISSDGRARLIEKESTYRERLIELFETSFGVGRIATRRQRLGLAPYTNVAVPSTWSVADRGRHKRASDPTGQVELAVSCLGRGNHRQKRIAGRLREALDEIGQQHVTIAETSRGDLDVVWAALAGTSTGDSAPRCWRWLLAAGDHAEVFASCSWTDQATPWVVPEWERIVSTLCA